jgi:hypothetical protein
MSSEQGGVQIPPIRVIPLDQPDLPSALPLLDGLLAGNGMFHRRVLLEPDQQVDAIAVREA